MHPTSKSLKARLLQFDEIKGILGTAIDILIGMIKLEQDIVSQPTASQSVKRGAKIVKEKELKMMG